MPATDGTFRIDFLTEENSRVRSAPVGLIGGSQLSRHHDLMLIRKLSNELGNAIVATTPLTSRMPGAESLTDIRCGLALGFGLDTYRHHEVIQHLRHFGTTILVDKSDSSSYAAEADYFIAADPSEVLASFLAAIRRERRKADRTIYEPYKLF